MVAVFLDGKHMDFSCPGHVFVITSSIGNILRVTGPLRGEQPVTGEFPSQRPATRSFDVFFLFQRLNKQLSKQSIAADLRRHVSHCDVTVMLFITQWCFLVRPTCLLLNKKIASVSIQGLLVSLYRMSFHLNVNLIVANMLHWIFGEVKAIKFWLISLKQMKKSRDNSLYKKYSTLLIKNKFVS